MPYALSTDNSIFQFYAVNIDGDVVPLRRYRGYVTLIVNMQAMYKRLAGCGLRILAFPSHQLGGQEPRSEAVIKKAVFDKFGVTFDMFSKIEVHGANAHPLYKFLQAQLGPVQWNFAKFLVDRNGQPVKHYSHMTEPHEFEEDVVNLLAA
ncbi:phospholipid-hydroperoxide glutathione peroxidase [Paragonimus westermani]|uniref:Phospholipid-hydroperoxide glutathione peroxidase n=1 Tax=Paragonimus westermani TaxID=34504 RepID=A0A5J4NW18_9TREM|nr:phospholipid-hydroperoxide glutathione peroxidase [Paragonimus westermani]